jgi:hypothetical protein
MKIATMAIAMTFLLPGTWALAQTGTAGGPTSLSGTGPSNIGGMRPADLGNTVAPRTHRRHAMNANTRAGYYGAGAGTAGAVAATSPNWGWGWGGNPYPTGYAGGPYYGGSVRGARASYYGGYPSPAWGGVSNSDREMYIKNLRDSGYNLKNNFNAAGNIQG